MRTSSNSSNITYLTSEELEQLYSSLVALGPLMQSVLIALYSLTALLALGGNTTVIVVLLFGKRSSRELRVFLVNLALSDITMALFSIPFTYTDFMLGRWIFLPTFCPIVLFMQHVSVIVSVYTLTAIGVDRYYAIMYPLNSRWTKSRGPIIVGVIWFCAMALSSAQLVHGKAEKFSLGGQDLYDCNEIWDEFDGKVYTVGVFAVTFVLPMMVLTFVYSSIGWKMWRHTSPGNADASRDQHQLLAKIKVVKMMAIVVLLFASCWLPIHIFNLLIYFNPEFIMPTTDDDFLVFTAAFFCCHWFSMANSFVNPIIYCFMSENFRTDLKQLLSCCCMLQHRRNYRGAKGTRNQSSFRTTTMVLSTCSVKNNCNAHAMKQLPKVLAENGLANTAN